MLAVITCQESWIFVRDTGQVPGTLATVDLTSPLSDVITGARGRVLSSLATLTAPTTIRFLARNAGVSPQGALDVVNDLREAGLVHVEAAGPSSMVSLNRSHLAAAAVIELATLRGALIDRLEDEVAGWGGLAGAWLLGSAARGDGDRASDIDLVLVAASSTSGAAWVEQSDQLRTAVHDWTGNDVQLIEHTTQSFRKLVRRSNPLVTSLRVEGIALTASSQALLARTP